MFPRTPYNRVDIYNNMKIIETSNRKKIRENR